MKRLEFRSSWSRPGRQYPKISTAARILFRSSSSYSRRSDRFIFENGPTANAIWDPLTSDGTTNVTVLVGEFLVVVYNQHQTHPRQPTSLTNSPADTTTISVSSSSREKFEAGVFFSGSSGGNVSPLCTAILLVRCGDRFGAIGFCGKIFRIRFGIVISICHGHRSDTPSMQGNHELVDILKVSFVV